MARSPKALIIACQKYPRGEDIAQELPGTLDSARQFYQWFLENKAERKAPDNKPDPSHAYVCCDSELVAGHPAGRAFASTRAGIKDAITELVENHRNNVDELYVFFSGHGLGYEQSPQQRGLDLLLTTDYKSRGKSGDACVNVPLLQEQMEIWIGGNDHYYFIDACRTILKLGEFKPEGLGLTLDPATAGDPARHALYSTKFGEAASVNPKFPKALQAGLRGEGRAKARVKQSWWVRFDRLAKYVESQVDIPVDWTPSSREGLIARLDGPFSTPLAVKVDGAAPDTKLELKIETSGIDKNFPFEGPAFEKQLAPNEAGYGIEVLFNGKPLRRLAPPDDDAFDLFEPVEFRCQMPMAGPTASPAAHKDSVLSLRGADSPGVRINVLDAKGKTVLTGSRGIAESPLPPGRYRVEVLESGRRIQEQEISIRRGARAAKDVFETSSRVRRSIASHVPTSDEGRVVDFSETLGPLAQQHTALWLSVLGASRIIRDPRQYSKIGKFPLANFEDLKRDESAVYVLAGLEHASRAQVSVSPEAAAAWKPMQAVAGFEGVLHQRVKVKPGPYLVSFALPARAPVTFSTFALPNRAVLFAVTEEQGGKFEVRQMLLPIYTLSRYLPPVVTERATREGLKLVRYLVLQQDRFAKRESLAPVAGQERQDLDSLLYGKWLDPLLALTAIYEMARRGDTGDHGKMREAAGNLERYFGDLPDVGAVRRMLDPKKRSRPAAGVPLLRESLLRGNPKLLETLPLPAGMLDYGSMWTSWLGAVKGPRWRKE